jgi:hypothetical protein
MKTLHRFITLIFSVFIMIGLAACDTPGFNAPTATWESSGSSETEESHTLPTIETYPTPTFSVTIIPTEMPTPVSTGPGQIAYISGGNVWRYLISDGQSVQVTMDGAADNPETRYSNPQFSPDGRYLAFTKNGVSSVVDLTSGDVIDLMGYGMFFRWDTSGNQFFTTRGDFECPSLENLDDQDLLNFDVLRYNLSNLETPEIIANVGGGLKFLTAISNDGQWAGIQNCACYSECGSTSLWHLPTASTIAMPEELYAGNLDFSPDASQVILSQYQMYGYVQSPLYVAGSDLYNMTVVFEEANVAPTLALWSPDGAWIAFTAISFDQDSMEATDSRVILIRPDASEMTVAASGFAELVDWSPDSSKLLYKLGDPASETFYIYDLDDWSQTPVPMTIDPYTSRSMDWGRLP